MCTNIYHNQMHVSLDDDLYLHVCPRACARYLQHPIVALAEVVETSHDVGVRVYALVYVLFYVPVETTVFQKTPTE